MKRFFSCLLFAVLAVWAVTTTANIVYTVNISDGSDTLTGTITTDGTLGDLAPANFVSWSLHASGSGLSFDVIGGTVGCLGGTDCGITADASQLTFTDQPGVSNVTQFSNLNVTVDLAGDGVRIFDLMNNQITIDVSHPYGIGDVAAPISEPNSGMLLAIAFIMAGLAGFGQRKRI